MPKYYKSAAYTIAVGVNDGLQGAAQAYTLTVANPVAPTITSTPPTTATPGRTYRYDVRTPNSETLTYRLENAPNGMTIDSVGRIVWNVPTNATGTINTTIIVSDNFGGQTTQPLLLNLIADTQPPAVRLQPIGNVYTVDTPNGTQYQIDVSSNATVTLRAVATDNLKVDSLQLLVNGTAVAMDAMGVATVPVGVTGSTLNAIAIAKDTSGNTASQQLAIQFIDLSVTTDIALNLDLSTIPNATITQPVEIRGTVADLNNNPVSYKLEVQPISGGAWSTVFSGQQAVQNGVLGIFDPTLLPNDAYTLRLTATDATGNTTFVENTVDVTGELKLGNFQLSFTDLEVPVAGIPISVTRTYDSLTANQQENFGYGWRLEFRDTNLTTSLPPRSEEQEWLEEFPAFKDGTKVYVTLPGGKRQSFTFKPKLHPEVLKAMKQGARWPESALFYQPAFVADDGSGMKLEVDAETILYNKARGEYISPNGLGYNPQHYFFGGSYTLTTKEGIKYEIDATSGDLNTVTDLNGNTLTYTDAGIRSSNGTEVKFERDAEGRISAVIDPAGNKIKYEYDAKGDLVKVIDREGNATQFYYEEPTRSHYLTRIEDPLGRDGLRTEYGEDGRLKRMLDVNGAAVELNYDLYNSVQTVKDVLGNPTTYVYDNRGNVLTEIDPLGKVTKRGYDENNQVLFETIVTAESGPNGWTTTYSYDAEGNKLSETDALGNITRWTYNSRGQVLTETDALGNTVTYTYSTNGNLLSAQDAAGNITKFSYDGRGNLLTLTDAANNITRFQYDASGNVLSIEDAEGNQTIYTYDNNGNRLTETRTVTTLNGIQTIVTKSDYDSNGRIRFMTDAENKVTEYRYDASGNQVAVIDALNRKTEYRYDDKGQLIETIYPDSTPNNPADNLRTINLYDRGGRLRATIDRDRQITHYNYDNVGRLIETIYPDAGDTLAQLIQAIAPSQTPTTIDWTKVVYPPTSPTFLSNNPRSKTEYYQNGDVKAEIDELENRTEYLYNPNGQLVEVIYPDGTPNDKTDNPRTRTQYNNLGQTVASIDALGRITRYEYDDLGLLVKTIYPDATPNNQADNPTTQNEYDNLGRRITTTDAGGKTVKYEYDVLGRLTAVVQTLNQSETQPIQLRTEYGYDEAGRLIWIEDAADNRTEFEYDKNGRRVTVELPLNQRSTMTYDAAGNLQSVTDYNGNTVTYSYDAENRLVSKQFAASSGEAPLTFTYTPSGQTQTIVDGRGTTTFNYDELGRLISRIDPDGPYLASNTTIEYKYDAAGNQTEVRTPAGTTQYEYDEQNRLKKVIDSDLTETKYFYDFAGNLSRVELPNGIVETRTYDELNQLKLLQYQRNGEIIQSFDYRLDSVGHRQVVTEENGRKVEYAYDDLYRLTKETIFEPLGGIERTISYSYDAVGNRLTKTDSVEGVTTYTYDENDRLLKEELRQNNVLVGSVEYGYDNNGNTQTRTKKDAAGNVIETVTYSWNQENRLVGVQNSNGDAIIYTYDPDGVRVSQTVNGVITEYLVDKNRDYAQVLEEYVNDALAASYVYGLDLISQERGVNDSFYLVDGLGSTRGLMNASGIVTDTYSYDAFGNLIGISGETDNRYLFAGEQFDPNLGDYYLRQRYYEPTTGRFTRRDTYSGHISAPMTLHKYIYANANPVNGVDPSGFATLTENLSIINLLGQLAANTYITVSRSVQAAHITAGFVALAAGIFLYTLIKEPKKSKKDEFSYKLYPEEPDQRKIIDNDPDNANQMRVQTQYKQQYDHGIALIASPEVGVTKAQVYNGLWHLWGTRGSVKWLSSSQDQNLRRAIVRVSQKVKDRVGPTSLPREQVATSQWMPDGREVTRGDYRVDAENLRGTNLQI